MEITTEDITDIFPRPLTEEETTRAGKLVEQSIELIRMAFSRRNRNLAKELEQYEWLPAAIRQAVRIMVSQAVLIGENIGQASASSTTGPQSDSITWSQGVGIHWGGVGLDDMLLDLLGLSPVGLPQGKGGQVAPFGHRYRRWPWLAEGAERPRR